MIEGFENLAETLSIFVTLVSVHLPSGGLPGHRSCAQNHRLAIHDEQGPQTVWRRDLRRIARQWRDCAVSGHSRIPTGRTGWRP